MQHVGVTKLFCVKGILRRDRPIEVHGTDGRFIAIAARGRPFFGVRFFNSINELVTGYPDKCRYFIDPLALHFVMRRLQIGVGN